MSSKSMSSAHNKASARKLLLKPKLLRKQSEAKSPAFSFDAFCEAFETGTAAIMVMLLAATFVSATSLLHSSSRYSHLLPVGTLFVN